MSGGVGGGWATPPSTQSTLRVGRVIVLTEIGLPHTLYGTSLIDFLLPAAPCQLDAAIDDNRWIRLRLSIDLTDGSE